jgi:hypothetical protein
MSSKSKRVVESIEKNDNFWEWFDSYLTHALLLGYSTNSNNVVDDHTRETVPKESVEWLVEHASHFRIYEAENWRTETCKEYWIRVGENLVSGVKDNRPS